MALVLAGGQGASLSVLSAERAESALPFGGKYRVVDFVLSNCCHSGIVKVGVLTQHAPTSLHDHIGSGRPWDLDRRDARVFILQPFLTRESSGWYRGTADALAQSWDLIEESRVRRVLVLPGDHVYKMDYRALARTHEERGARVTIAVAEVPQGRVAASAWSRSETAAESWSWKRSRRPRRRVRPRWASCCSRPTSCVKRWPASRWT